MIVHSDLGPAGFKSSKALKLLIDAAKVTLAGNRRLKIYGLLTCSSGKRLKRSNRVFFSDAHEAISEGYRPCGNCKRDNYRAWAKGSTCKPKRRGRC